MEPTIYKPSIYKGAGIYKTGAGGGGGEGYVYYDSIEPIADGFYKCVKVGNKLFMNEFLQQPIYGAIVTPYGALYKYDALFNSDGTMNGNFTSRPNTSGWRLPTNDEFNNLFVELDAKQIDFKSKYGWYNNGNGTGEKKLSFFPIGYTQSIYPDLDKVSKQSYWWTSTVISASDAYAIGLSWNKNTGSTFGGGAGTNKNFYFGIRLVKDL